MSNATTAASVDEGDEETGSDGRAAGVGGG